MVKNVAIVVGSRGRGSNMQVLATRISQTSDIRVCAVVAPSETAPAVSKARELGLLVHIVPYGPEHEADLLRSLSDAGWVCLAGYMKLVPTAVLAAHPGRVLNIHPALLPKFGGKGMFGHHVHQAVIESGESESGCTVHFVTENYDEGKAILQKRCPVLATDTADSLAERVLSLEHDAYFEALRSVVGSKS